MTTEKKRRSNPYDYNWPVTDSKMFAGRKEELALAQEEIKKLLAEPSTSPMIAIAGERRVGKTSFLNELEKECQTYPLLTARLDLTGDTATSPWDFWRALFGLIIQSLKMRGLLVPSNSLPSLGFKTSTTNGQGLEVEPSIESLQFGEIYRDSVLSRAPIPVYVLQEDLRLLCEWALRGGYRGILIMIDEAQLLVDSDEIQQQLRHAVAKAGKCGVVFSGSPPLGRMFNDVGKAFYGGQVFLIPLQNFLNIDYVAECALLPLSEDERQLMNPMTIEYLARLSQGKPNQIRLICSGIYSCFERGEQDDLNVSIRTLDEALRRITSLYTEYDIMKRQVDRIQRLVSVDLESLYNMTRYPDWSTNDVVEVDESFRGWRRSNLACKRRTRLIQDKRDKFIKDGLMSNVPDKCVLAGDEFIYLYLRFWYEIRKYGGTSSLVQINRGVPTPFTEKVCKLADLIALLLGRRPRIRLINIISDDSGMIKLAETVKRRFLILKKLIDDKSPEEFTATKDEFYDAINECFKVCELVRESGPHQLVWLLARDLENPRQLIHIEMYFDPLVIITILSPETRRILVEQSHEAKILLEDLNDIHVPHLPKLSDFLRVLGAPSIDQFLEEADTVERWRIASVQRLVAANRKVSSLDANGKQEESQDEDDKWIELYAKGHVSESEQILNDRISKTTDRTELAHYYNDRGYIRYSLKKVEAEKDLETALSLHFHHLTLTLLNLGIVDIDKGNYPAAIQKIEDALFLTLDRSNIEAGYLRLRLPRSQMDQIERCEQRPANCLEASYINLAYALLKMRKPGEATETLQEGLALLHNSARLKHALARLHLCEKHWALADSMYLETSELMIDDQIIKNEVEAYVKRLSRSGRDRKQSRG